MKTKQELVDDALALAVQHGIVYSMKWLADQFQDDSVRLEYVCKEFDSYFGISEDKYDFAMQVAWKNGRDEPNRQDEVEGLRRLIDKAMAIHHPE